MENPKEKVRKSAKEVKAKIINKEEREVYIRENICDVFEIHYSKENEEKYGYIIENVKKYVEKMMGD